MIKLTGSLGQERSVSAEKKEDSRRTQSTQRTQRTQRQMGEMAGPISPCGYPLLIPILKLDGCTRIQMHILVTQLLVFVIYLSYDAEKW